MTWLTQAALEPVQDWLEQRPSSSCQHMFLNQHGQPLSVAGVEYRLKQYCQQAQVQLTCHQLRHTFARRLAEQGMPIESLAKLLGHQSIQTTQLYIDGADPTVRQDFLTALKKASPGRPGEPTVTSAQLVPAAGPTRAEPLDPVALVDQLSHLTADLPAWLHSALRGYLISRINRWQPHQARLHAHNRLASLARASRWLVQQRHWSSLDQLQRADLSAYVQACQARGLKPQSIATELKVFGGFWRYLIDQEYVTNGAILRVKAPPPNRDPLPRYLSPLEFQRLEQAVLADTGADRPQDHFHRACFYLLAHTGLRRGELLNLRLADCDLAGRRLRVQAGKGDRDRVLPMTDRLVTVLAAYLAVREPATTDHLLIHRGAPVSRFLITRRLKRWGQLADITDLYPHRLRHTLATLLVNQGMPIISLQKFLGHQDINKTLIYARVYDETVHQQFAAAMAPIDRIPVANWPGQIEQLNPGLILTTVAPATQCNETSSLSAE
jgi:site-specific recombinase XerD